MEFIHKINQLESVVSSVVKHLNEPDLIKDLREKESNKKFWATVDPSSTRSIEDETSI